MFCNFSLKILDKPLKLYLKNNQNFLKYFSYILRG